MKTIAVLGTLDSKGIEHAFLAEQIRQRGHKALLIDVGVGSAPQITPDISRDEVTAGDPDWPAVVARNDRGECVTAISQAAPRLLLRLLQERRIDGVISLGGGGGTAIAAAAMRALPIGFPKLIVSTLASGNTAHYLGEKDIVMMPSIVDVAGLNRISKTIFRNAAGAICGMVETEKPTDDDDKRLIVASMFGNTTDCVNHAKTILEQAGYEVLVFHSTGAGGRAMESLIESGMVAGVLDITTTEWADELVGGVLSAGPHRLEAAAKAGIPAIIAPGCLDMVNFGEPTTIPADHADRQFYAHNPQVTLMRTSPAESTALGHLLATRLNTYTAPVSLLLPLQGLSILGAPGHPFHNPTADAALFTALKQNLRPDIEVIQLDCAINDPVFAEKCAETLLANMAAS
ncbi:Tm-1-like ATP-binding domain-containing protein [Lignipirellula cremea]|uniref:Uncharacterized protein n=1 Tax=Lignipirellula cremea TaxID=2528010 RepID=A0A518E4X0_9BACT|nr:Tm-1-like ATP-binding domain-containing protein [Lignipirellula cremea]QDU99118.1 hypothetical protein Pla8534_70290 [Lignipirellula cremea]